MGKKVWQSKSLGLVLIGFLAAIIQTKYGYIIDPETQIYLYLSISAWIRTITTAPIEWKFWK